MSDTQDPWFMAGTEGTGQYVVVACSARGRVGFRDLGSSVRVRVEPADAEASTQLAPKFPVGEWKQPEQFGQFRFSSVVGRDVVIETVERAIKALGRDQLERNPAARYWRKPFKPATTEA